MNTKSKEPSLEDALANMPARLRERLIESYTGLKSALAEGEHDSCGLRAGRFCEVMLRVLQQRLTQTFIPFGTKIGNFKAECERLEQLPHGAGPEGLRIIAPRALSFIYTLRNKRGIGHVGGDVDANEIDAATCARGCDWVLAEVIRVVHSLSLEDAQNLIDAIAERRIPIVWNVGGKKRVLDHSLDYPSQTLLMLYSDATAGVLVEDLFNWTEYSNIRDFKRYVLKSLHKKRMVEFDQDINTVTISPAGIRRVEQDILPRVGRDGINAG